MKALFYLMLLASTLLASFKNSTYNNRDELVLETFGVDPSFLYDQNFLDMKNALVSDLKKDHLMRRYDEAYDFVPLLKEMIIKAEIPQEFLYLAMAESEFSVRAFSPKKASGLWQFMPKTAQIIGLRIDEFVDERRDPIRSTEAAITYLKNLHGMFGKWYLAAIAYNCGEGRLQKAIAQAGSDELSVLLDPDKKYLPRESRNYIRKILSISMMFHSVDMLKSSDYEHFLNRGATTTIATVKVKAGTHLYKVAEGAGMSLEELKQFNRHFKYSFTPPGKKEYSVYLPYDRLASFKQNYRPESHGTSEMFIVHSVQKGDTLASLAKRYGTTLQEIKIANDLKSAALSLNQRLIIPVLKSASNLKEYVTKQGDTVESISKRFNVSIENLKRLNNLQHNLLEAGVKLVLAH
ncbi:lytic transglycosylase domain-containing protein [Wolinella succinogenes]|uniref:REGULATORY PROTEIN DNIR n=1 Tax=Wolinella succinogenes (strain ATCC 29543 / DSM 1740 / CCUG 13145 / JCM 31913 / LMG 7466 / NCTC 11488 / FDC 602W) TaxID=273121 RepID=Q7M7V0_WOLSU|nr:lytic transglycosylase domain-containing protein [Wolinella succinogenes]NLU33615.1 transglycosylase SLT domain-containing protein [Wolinella succinogenes]CAE11071.1 REGULATORY PROTEIN DNIR [Wolinella succinogenes]VEG81236.1 Membrane-bound lytic murein transglycosylase D precursor [Wolinella succinogenes]HCZ19130.1 lytic transglycosylase [Helicobacter sp.]